MLKGIYNNIDFYNKAINGTWERNKAITHNMANVNTPNYKRKTVTFEDQLKKSLETSKVTLKKTHSNHISTGSNGFSPRVLEESGFAHRIDGNNVNIDTEAAELAKNNIMYNALINQVIGEFEKIKTVITEGSK